MASPAPCETTRSLATTTDAPAGGDDALRFQVLSDIHLEMRQGKGFPVPPRTAPYLALLGDIGAGYDIPDTTETCYDHLVRFIEACCAVFDQVF